MALFSELVCVKCHSVLSYPMGAVSCRCLNCRTINPAQYLKIECPGCREPLLLPINTIEALCPCCTSIIEIPVELLPVVPRPCDPASRNAASLASMYVEGPIAPDVTRSANRAPRSTGVATQIV